MYCGMLQCVVVCHGVAWSSVLHCVVLCCVVLCCVVLCCVVLCCVVLCCVVLCCVVLCCVVLCCVVLCCVVLCCVVLCCVVLCCVGQSQFRAARGTPCHSACWCSWCSRSVHAIVPLGPMRALMRLSRVWTWASQTFCNSDKTCRMNSVPVLRSCGPASSICAIRMAGFAMAADHCSRTTGTHNWPCTWDARGPTYVLSHVWRG